MKELHESGEMYLETILLLSKEKSEVRSIDVSEEMGFSKPSVSRAIGILKKDKYITVDDSGYIKLTASGKEIAEKIYDRHVTLSKFLQNIGVSEDTATEDACRIEHVISDETLDAIKKQV